MVNQNGCAPFYIQHVWLCHTFAAMKFVWLNLLNLLFVLAAWGQKTEQNNMIIQLTEGHQVDRHPSWSPDGKHMLYSSNLTAFEQVFSLNMESLAVNQLTHEQAHARNPSWHPDGQQVLFDSDISGKSEMYIIRKTGQQPEKLIPRDIESRSGMLNINANLLVFLGKDPNERHWNVYTYDFTYNNLNKVTRHENHCQFPRWSPNADYISYHQQWHRNSSRPGIIHWYGKPKFKPTFDGIAAHDLNWSPDGYKILYIVKEHKMYHLYTSRRDGSEKVLLHSSRQKIAQPAWAPAGDSVVFCLASDDGSQHLWLLRLH